MTTRLQLRTSVRVAADQDNSTYPADVAVNDIIDRSARTVWRRMIVAGWKPDRTTVSITANGAASYTVGTDVSVVHTVMFLGTPTGTSRIPLHRVKPEELPELLIPSSGNQASAYDLIGGGTTAMTIELYPVPTNGSYEVRYTKRFPGFTADGDNWFGPDGSDEVIILLSAIECANKEGDPGSLTRALEERLKERWSEVCEAAGWADSQGQQTVRDTNRITKYPFDFRGAEAYDE